MCNYCSSFSMASARTRPRGRKFSGMQRNSSDNCLFTARELPQHVLRYLKTKNIAEEIGISLDASLKFNTARDGTSSLELSGSYDSHTVDCVKQAILEKVESFEQKSFPVSHQECLQLSRIQNRIIITKLRDHKVWAGWFVNEASSTLDICCDTAPAVEQAHEIIMQLGGFGIRSVSTPALMLNFGHSPNFPSKPLFSLPSVSGGNSKHHCEEHTLRYLNAKGVTKALNNKHGVEIQVSFKKLCLEVKGASENVESADAEIQGILATLLHEEVSLQPSQFSQWQSLAPQTIITQLKPYRIVAGWCCRNGLLKICTDNQKSAATAKIVLLGLVQGGHRFRTASNSSGGGDFRDKFSVETENLRFLKTTKDVHDVEQEFCVVVNVDVNSGSLEVVGVQSQVFAAIEELHEVMKTYEKIYFDKEPIFLKCLKNMANVAVIGALRSSKVAAGWDVRDDQLIVCADTKSNVTKAANAINELVLVSEHVQDGLSQVQTNADWFALVKKWSQANVHVEIDVDSSLVRYAMPAADNAASVTNDLKTFFDSFQQKTCVVAISEKIKQLLYLNKNKVEAGCQYDKEEPVSVHITDGSVQLTSNSRRSLDLARQLIEAVINGCSEKIHEAEKCALVSWMKTSTGKERLAEICSMNNVTHTLAFTSVHSDDVFLLSGTGRLDVVDADISQLQVGGVLTGKGALRSVMENACATKIKPGIQRAINVITGHSCYVYHVELEDWRDAHSLKLMKGEVRAAMTAFSSQGLKKVALPAIGTGNLHYPCTDVANTLVSAVEEFLNSNPQTSIQEVTFVAYGHPQMIVAFTTAVANTISVHLPQGKQVAKVTFTALTDDDAARAVNRLKTDLKEMLMVETWDNDPLRSSISHLSSQMVAEIEKEGEGNDVDVVLDRKTNSITLEGLKDGVRSVREKINRLLHQLKGDQIPANWSRADSDAGKLMVRVDPSSSEYLQVSVSFITSSQALSIRIIEISRVQNIELYKMYGAWKEKVTKQVAPGVTVERSLWHGTDAGSVQSICQNEFNRSFAGRHGTAYGKGSYFSTSAQYSIGYSKDIGDKYIILAKVVTGKHKVGNSSADRKSLPEGYHSTTNSQSSPSIFVVYHDASAYPEYVIKFRS